MESTTINDQDKDQSLWELAKKRASFKHHLTVYIVMNIFFWGVWLLTNHKYSDITFRENSRIPWPVWPMFGWGIGIFFHFMGAYVNHQNNSVEKEYQKLKNKQSSK
jgi:hypothetical protein